MMRTNSPASSIDQQLNDKCYAYGLLPESGKVSLENFCLATFWTILLRFHSCLSSEVSVFIAPFVLVSLSQQLTNDKASFIPNSHGLFRSSHAHWTASTELT